MHYLNPFELLNLSPGDTSDVDSKVLFREKKKLLHEIELSDTDSIYHNGVALTKSECLKAIDDLDDDNKREFHFFIYQNKPLNDFLSQGTLSFFEQFKVESIYKLKEFLDFISPYFASQYDKALAKHFQKKDVGGIKKIISVAPITNETFFEACYTSTYSFIRNIDNEINRLIKSIEVQDSPYIDQHFNGLDSFLSNTISVESLNLLPSYFQGLRNQIAQSIRNLARDINNDPFNNYLMAFKVIEIANNISTNGLVKQTITKGYYTIKGNYTNELNKVAPKAKDPLFEQYTSLVGSIFSKLGELENKTSTPATIMNWVNIAIPFTELNSLNGEFGEIRKHVALGLRGISVEIWNQFSDINGAIFVIEKALSIDTDTETKESLISDRNKLTELKQKATLAALERQTQLRYSPATQIPRVQPDTKKDYSGCLVFLIIAAVIGIISLISNSKNSSSHYDNSTYTPTTTADSTSSSAYSASGESKPTYDSTKSISIPPLSTNTPTIDPLYQPVKMKNGNIPGCSLFRPSYDYEINNKLVISAETTDAAVKLINDATGECIRFVFIKAGTTYSVRNIPQGRYYVKIAYGEQWSVLTGDPKCKGHFTLNAVYKKGDEILDFFMTPTVNGYDVPSYNLKLSTFFSDPNSNTFNTDHISETDFENN